MRTAILAAVAGCGLGALVGAAAAITYVMGPPALPSASTRAPRWTETKWAETRWPFPIDQWGTGTAFRCRARDCGTDVDIYLRAKIGFCNCTTGVADDDELERVADLDLFGAQRRATTPGRDIQVRRMKGRSRAYSLASPPRAGQSVLAVAFNDRCDVIVATVVAADNRPSDVEAAALAFLDGDLVARWTKTALGP